MFKSIFLDTIHNVWPMVFIFCMILISIRLVYLITNKQKFVLYKELLMLFFIIYILLLYYIISFQDNNYGTNNFVPFKEIFRYKLFTKLFFKNIIGNIVLFIPFGIFVTHFIKFKKKYPVIFLSCLISCAIEFAQLKIGRTADIDDVILNTFGGLIGCFIYSIGKSLLYKFPKVLRSQLFLDILSLLFILIIIYLAFRFNFWRFLS